MREHIKGDERDIWSERQGKKEKQLLDITEIDTLKIPCLARERNTEGGKSDGKAKKEKKKQSSCIQGRGSSLTKRQAK